jgi:signal transduction histidine kinase
VIGGNLEMIAAGDLSPSGRRAVARAQEAAARAARITQRLLAFARKQPLNQQVIDVTKALGDMAEMLQRTIGEAVAVEMHLTPGVGQVSTDIDQFETAILNLAVNARDAMPSGGRLVIEAERVTIGDDMHGDEETPPGDYIRVSISDTGAGMTPEVRARAIEPFFTTKDVGSGTGLGLSMVYGFMKQIGGHANLYSEVGQGTRVSLLPPPYRMLRSNATRRVRRYHRPAKPFFIVEDDADVRQITVSRLRV